MIGAHRTRRIVQRTSPHRPTSGAESTRSTQHAALSQQLRSGHKKNPNCANTACMRSIQRATREHATYRIQRATYQCNMSHRTGHKDRSHTTSNMQHYHHAMRHSTYVNRAPHTLRHATIKCNMSARRGTPTSRNITPHTMQRTSLPMLLHATHTTASNKQQGSRTAEERAMLPPLNETDPPSMLTAPPPCTRPPQSASDPIGPLCNAHPCGFSIGDRHRLERDGPTPHRQHAAVLHTSQHARRPQL
jgi:hypothetical protein